MLLFDHHLEKIFYLVLEHWSFNDRGKKKKRGWKTQVKKTKYAHVYDNRPFDRIIRTNPTVDNQSTSCFMFVHNNFEHESLGREESYMWNPWICVDKRLFMFLGDLCVYIYISEKVVLFNIIFKFLITFQSFWSPYVRSARNFFLRNAKMAHPGMIRTIVGIIG